MEGQRYCWPALEWQGNLMIKNMEKAEVFGTVCSSAFTGTICFRALKACVSSGRVWRKDVLLKVYKAKVMFPLSKADINNSIGPGRTREAEEASSCQCYTALSSPNIHDNQLKSQKIGKRQMTCLSPKRERKRSQKITALWSASPQSVKIKECAFLEAMSGVARHAWPIWLSSVVRWLDNGRAVDSICFNFSRAFGSLLLHSFRQIEEMKIG